MCCSTNTRIGDEYDGKLYTKTSGGVVKEVGGAGAVTLQAVTNAGAVTSNDITLNGANLVFEVI